MFLNFGFVLCSIFFSLLSAEENSTNVVVDDTHLSVKIIGGKNVIDRSGFPYQVSLRSNSRHFCGGTIISRTNILTAAHCSTSKNTKNGILSRKTLLVVAGSLSLTNPNFTVVRDVQKITIHPGYNSTSIVNDIAVWTIDGTFGQWNNYVQPIPISNSEFTSNTMCNVSGWGVTHDGDVIPSPQLQYVTIPLQSRTFCRQIYGFSVIGDSMICAGSEMKDSCQGDSGGPLVCNGFLYGIVSFGAECGKYLGVYTEASKYRKWIIKQINNSKSNVYQPTKYLFVIVISIIQFS